MPRYTLITSIRNHAPYITEWVAHHLAVGFDDFVFCVHGSSDGTARVTRRLAAMGYGTHLKIEVEEASPRAAALKAAADHGTGDKTDWVGYLDIWEFLMIHDGRGQLCDLLQAQAPAATALSCSSGLFGAGPVTLDQQTSLTQRGVLAPTATPLLARSMDRLLEEGSAAAVASDVAQINRYACKSTAHLAQALSTPSGNDSEEICAAWARQNETGVEDTSASRYADWRNRYEKQLLSDRKLRLAQQGGRERHAALARSALEDPVLGPLIAATTKS